MDVLIVLQLEMLVFRKFWNRGIPLSRYTGFAVRFSSFEVRYENVKFHLPALGGRDRWSASCVPTRKSRGRSVR